MSKVVLDASALLALVNKENGCEKVAKCLPEAIMSTINYSEVLMVLNQIGLSSKEAVEIIESLIGDLVDFDNKQAIESALLRNETKKHGLSLGDRACLALAKLNQLPVVTADGIWKKLNIGVEIQLIR